MGWEGWFEGDIERPGREVVEGDLESRDEPRRLELLLDSLPRERLLGNNLDSKPDIIAAMPFRPWDRLLVAAWSEIVDEPSDFASSPRSTARTVDALRSFS